MNISRGSGRPAAATSAGSKRASGTGPIAAATSAPSRKPALPVQPSRSPPPGWGSAAAAAAALKSREFNDDDDAHDTSMDDDAWEAGVADRHAFLAGLGGIIQSSAMVPASSPSVPQPRASPPAAPDDLGGHAHPPVPSLFEIAVQAFGIQFAAISAQELSQRLPPGTLRAALAAVQKAERLDDSHLPLLFRTLASKEGHNEVCSRSWLEKDCGLEGLVSSALENGEQDSAVEGAAPAPSASPSASPPPTAGAELLTAPAKARAAASKKVVGPPVVSANARFAPLKGTPGISSASVGHSMNTATLARAAKAQKVAAQIAAHNLQPVAKPNVSAQSAVVQSNVTGKRASMGSAAGISAALAAVLAKISGGSADAAPAPQSVIPREFLIDTGELLDLHAQHRITESGFMTLAKLMEYIASHREGGVAEFGLAPSNIHREDQFTEEQRARLAAVGVSSELRTMVRSVVPSSAAAAIAVSSAQSSIPDIVQRLGGTWRPSHVVHLDISFTAVTNTALTMLAKQMPHLLKVNICGCEKITNTGLASLVRYAPRIQVLLMEVLPCLNDTAVQDIVHRLKHLLSLDMGSCKKISNVSFQIIASHGKTLKRVSAAGCAHLNDFDVEDLSRCVSLLSLSLRACPKITDTSIESLVLLSKRKRKAGMRGLQSVDLGGCARLSDGGINALCAAYNDSLTHLDLRGLSRLTNRTLDAIQAHVRKSLKYLNVAECKGSRWIE